MYSWIKVNHLFPNPITPPRVCGVASAYPKTRRFIARIFWEFKRLEVNKGKPTLSTQRTRRKYLFPKILEIWKIFLSLFFQNH